MIHSQTVLTVYAQQIQNVHSVSAFLQDVIVILIHQIQMNFVPVITNAKIVNAFQETATVTRIQKIQMDYVL